MPHTGGYYCFNVCVCVREREREREKREERENCERRSGGGITMLDQRG